MNDGQKGQIKQKKKEATPRLASLRPGISFASAPRVVYMTMHAMNAQREQGAPKRGENTPMSSGGPPKQKEPSFFGPSIVEMGYYHIRQSRDPR